MLGVTAQGFNPFNYIYNTKTDELKLKCHIRWIVGTARQMGNAICVLLLLLVLIHNICSSPKRNGLSDTNYALFETVLVQLLYSFFATM